MIHLAKAQCPPVLQLNAAAWTQALLDAEAQGREPTKAEKSKYNEPTIKAALLGETNGKCAYCESKLRHIAYGDIEHILPKSSDKTRWFNWENLTVACDRCNTNKGEHEDVIDPYLVDPETHLIFMGALAFPRPGDDLAFTTERRLELNRDDLCERRSERLKSLIGMLDRIARVADQNVKEALMADFLEEGEANKEYAAMAREVIRLARAKGVLPVL